MLFPRVVGSNLEGQRYQLPQDLKGDMNIIIIAFRREYQNMVDGWIFFLEYIQKKFQDTFYYELPTLHKSYLLFRWFIDSGMRSGIQDRNSRERTITLYLNKRDFKKDLHIPHENTIYLFLIDRKGHIYWNEKGIFTQKKADKLEQSIKKQIK